MFFFSQTISKRTLNGISLILLFLMMTLPPVYGADDLGVVNVDDLNFRREPGTDLPPLMTLNKGEQIIILEESHDHWLKGICRGQVGYVWNKKGYVTVVKSSENIKNAGKPDSSTLDTLKMEAERVDKKIDQSQSKIITLTDAEKTLINGLNEIDLVLNNVRKKVAELEVLVSDLDLKIDETTLRIGDIKKTMQGYKKYANQRLVALYKLNRAGGMPQIFSSADSMYDVFKRKTLFQCILDHDEEVLTNYAQNMALLNELLKTQKKRKNEKQSLMTELDDQLRIVSTEKDKRAKLLAHIRSQQRLELAVIESLRQAQESLKSQIKSYHEQIDEQDDPEKKVEGSFARLKGLLKMPVRGKIISFFGPYKNKKYDVVNFRSGIDIETERGEPIRSVGPGKVLFSDWFKGYGNMMIIDHGDHYYTVYANIEELFKTKDSRVKADEVIATVGDSGSLIGPKLYFEIRYHGEPLDPLKWLKKG